MMAVHKTVPRYLLVSVAVATPKLTLTMMVLPTVKMNAFYIPERLFLVFAAVIRPISTEITTPSTTVRTVVLQILPRLHPVPAGVVYLISTPTAMDPRTVKNCVTTIVTRCSRAIVAVATPKLIVTQMVLLIVSTFAPRMPPRRFPVPVAAVFPRRTVILTAIKTA
jgi:hypothetical protein